MEELTLTVDEFLQLRNAFAGGHTHANAHYVEKVLENVSSFDLTSSYPTVMLLEKFPMSEPQLILDELDQSSMTELIKYKAVLMDVTFHNIVPRLYHEHPISISHCRNIKGVTLDIDEEKHEYFPNDNGHVVTAEQLTTTITEQDFITILEFYDWDYAEFKNVRIFDKQYLPKAIANQILTFYKDKTELKGVAGKEIEYLVSKGMINAIYGMMVTNPCRPEIDYINDIDDYKSIPVDYTKAINIYNNSGNRFLYYPWGVWVTAYARRNLFKAIAALGKDYVYSDTDSVKFLNRDAHMDFFNKYNSDIMDKIQKSAAYYHFDPKLYSPVTIKGKVSTIGLWDDEGTYDRFKTLGAKRYMYEKNGEYSLTMAGVNKFKACEYLCKLDPKTAKETLSEAEYELWETMSDDPLENFKIGQIIPTNYSGRLTTTYIDIETEGDVVDYTGTPYHYHELSSVHMEKNSYSMDMANTFIEFLLGMRVSSLIG